ncbi:MarR family transcriptional regulator [Actinoplanes missouriensis]|uniref:MarR family transcriptional regulator n=1 Tax=Actinoplanes missouriensis TaxID=1866 RepID=UPI0033DC3442
MTEAGDLRTALRDLRIELALNTSRVAALAGLNDSDLAVLDVLTREGAQSPTALAHRTGLHPATLTGVLARLEKTGWVLRRPDDTDRRSVRIEQIPAEHLTRLYRDVSQSLDELAEGLSDPERHTVLTFLRAATALVRTATERLR